MYIVVKRVSKTSEHGIKEYTAEIKIISQLRHKNLVELKGWCHEKSELLLIYEFMENGSLDLHLFKQKSWLTWDKRKRIAYDLASALSYLHEDCKECILHRDVKSNNVMLDSNFNAKLGDFGLARLVDHDKNSKTTMLARTLGYMAPEYVMTGKASKESDVYSFGVVALEIACGQKPIGYTANEERQTTLVEWFRIYMGLELF
uniref:L-type lectin-domain containing receptor kinase IX.1-like n=1 Tax=Erigeron canadensis TaxID=72917 RepID=UPI001CB90C9F|nr:L-type lectin-domain containing receptor kinase IX.1-like [Erigeron canadensis]